MDLLVPLRAAGHPLRDEAATEGTAASSSAAEGQAASAAASTSAGRPYAAASASSARLRTWGNPWFPHGPPPCVRRLTSCVSGAGGAFRRSIVSLLVCLPRGEAPLRRRIALALIRFGVGDLLDEPVGDTRRAERLRIHAGVAGPPVGNRLAVALDDVLVAEPRAADVHAARVNVEAVVEVRGLQVANVRFERQRFDAVVAE